MRTKNAQTQQRGTAKHANEKNRNSCARNCATYNFVMVKLVRLLSARPAAVSLVAIGLSLPNPL